MSHVPLRRRLEQTLAGGDMEPIRHLVHLLPQPPGFAARFVSPRFVSPPGSADDDLPQPPVSAWKTWISSSPRNQVAQSRPVAHQIAVHEHIDMTAQRTLIVQQITAQRRPRCEHLGQCLAHCGRLHLRGRHRQKALQARW